MSDGQIQIYPDIFETSDINNLALGDSFIIEPENNSIMLIKIISLMTMKV